jgi:hypothetical protein
VIKKFVLFIIVTLILILPLVAAHVPLLVKDGNNSLETARYLSEPTKSWVVYSDIGGGQEVDYYKMEFREGDRIYLSILTPEGKGFLPELIVMGPGLGARGEVPADVVIPDGYGYVVVQSEAGNPEYEPFTPGSYYYLASYDSHVNETGIYYVALYNSYEQGKYGLAVGFEEKYGVAEWICVPVDVIQIHRWEGQSLLFVLSPFLISVAAGLLGIFWLNRRYKPVTLAGWLTATVGFTYIGSGAIMLTQMTLAASTTNPGLAASVTLIFAVLPIVLGGFIVRSGVRYGPELEMKERAILVFYSLVGLFLWAGLIIGPTLAIIISGIPFSWLKR